MSSGQYTEKYTFCVHLVILVHNVCYYVMAQQGDHAVPMKLIQFFKMYNILLQWEVHVISL